MDRIFEFAANHYILVSAFFLLWTLFFFLESRRGSLAISSQRATSLINREEGVVIDLRDDDEFRKGHIAGSINVPFAKLNERVGELDKFRERPVVLVCGLGNQAANAGRVLQSRGFATLYRLRGGMQGWRADSLPVVRS